ncbi:MAG: DUF3575 domain-containing protein [Lewinellaceae bacterium]|nr:DUF3575 domain-containing protein [Lewinellaceae bacterium]
MTRFLLFCIFGILPFALSAQSNWAIAFEFQAYPTGLIPGIRADYQFQRHHSLHIRAGYNWIRHGNNGVQDDERGDGFGGTLGYRYYFRENWARWFIGARSDIWRNSLAWKELGNNGAVLNQGTSEITVFQPTAEAGYRFPLGGSWFVAPSAAFGVEINVKTNGAQVGEGAIFLLGISLGRNF